MRLGFTILWGYQWDELDATHSTVYDTIGFQWDISSVDHHLKEDDST